MPAIPFVMAAAAVAGTAATIKSGRDAKKQAAQSADLAKRQASTVNVANTQAALNAAEKERTAALVDKAQVQATEQLTTVADVAVADPTAGPAAKRRQVRSQFRMDGGADGALRI